MSLNAGLIKRAKGNIYVNFAVACTSILVVFLIVKWRLDVWTDQANLLDIRLRNAAKHRKLGIKLAPFTAKHKMNLAQVAGIDWQGLTPDQILKKMGPPYTFATDTDNKIVQLMYHLHE